MNLNLEAKTFIVTGSSRGIGNQIARVLLSEGANVVLNATRSEQLQEAVRELEIDYPNKVSACVGDVSDVQSCQQLTQHALATYGQLNGLVANAGAVKAVNGSEYSNSELEWFLSHNFFTAANIIEACIPHLEASQGAVVIINSIAGLESIGAPIPYSVSKAALAMYAKTLADKLAPKRIRVNSIAPGNILFSGGNWDKKLQAQPEKIEAMLQEKVPLAEFGDTDDIASMVAYLVSAKAKFITGEIIRIDGGQLRAC